MAKHWIAENGVKALVDGVTDRDRWTQVHGWAETSEPVAGDMVWLENEHTGGRQIFSAEAAPQWAGLGWHPAAPPEPADLTKDPKLVDQPAPLVRELAAAADETATDKPTTKARTASGSNSKEQ